MANFDLGAKLAKIKINEQNVFMKIQIWDKFTFIYKISISIYELTRKRREL